MHPPRRLHFIIPLIGLTLLTQIPAFAATKELLVGVGLVKPPYIMGPGGTGLEYDILARALEVSGYKMVAQSYPPARALALMQAGRLDAMASVTEGLGNGYFSNDYVTYHNVAITLTSRGIRLANVQALSHYSIAAFQNAHLFLGPDYAKAVRNHFNYTEYPQQLTQNKLLFAGRVDVVVADRLIFRYLTDRVTGLVDTTQPVTIHPIFPPTPRKMVFRSRSVRDDFNAGLNTIKQNGDYAKILERYRPYLRP